jgi:hypothetical protein
LATALRGPPSLGLSFFELLFRLTRWELGAGRPDLVQVRGSEADFPPGDRPTICEHKRPKILAGGVDRAGRRDAPRRKARCRRSLRLGCTVRDEVGQHRPPTTLLTRVAPGTHLRTTTNGRQPTPIPRHDPVIMRLLADRKLRRTLRLALKAAPYGPSLAHIDGLVEWVAQARADARKEAVRRLSTRMGLTVVGAIAAGLHSAILREDGPRVFIQDWAADNGGRPRAEDVAAVLLTQIANHALASLCLLECGLENSARVMSRVLHEVSWLVLVILSDKIKMRAYISAATDPQNRGSCGALISTVVL